MVQYLMYAYLVDPMNLSPHMSVVESSYSQFRRLKKYNLSDTKCNFPTERHLNPPYQPPPRQSHPPQLQPHHHQLLRQHGGDATNSQPSDVPLDLTRLSNHPIMSTGFSTYPSNLQVPSTALPNRLAASQAVRLSPVQSVPQNTDSMKSRFIPATVTWQQDGPHVLSIGPVPSSQLPQYQQPATFTELLSAPQLPSLLPVPLHGLPLPLPPPGLPQPMSGLPSSESNSSVNVTVISKAKPSRQSNKRTAATAGFPSASPSTSFQPILPRNQSK